MGAMRSVSYAQLNSISLSEDVRAAHLMSAVSGIVLQNSGVFTDGCRL